MQAPAFSGTRPPKARAGTPTDSSSTPEATTSHAQATRTALSLRLATSALPRATARLGSSARAPSRSTKPTSHGRMPRSASQSAAVASPRAAAATANASPTCAFRCQGTPFPRVQTRGAHARTRGRSASKPYALARTLGRPIRAPIRTKPAACRVNELSQPAGMHEAWRGAEGHVMYLILRRISPTPAPLLRGRSEAPRWQAQ